MNSGEVKLSEAELAHILSPAAIREGAAKAFDYVKQGKGHFQYHPDQLAPTVQYVLGVVRKNYPDLKIPFHSRWGHFRAGGIDRVKELDQQLAGFDKLERARRKLDLVIPSVLLDAGSGPGWKLQDGGRTYARSEGLGVASLRLFLAGCMAGDRKSLLVDAAGLAKMPVSDIETHFQVSGSNPLAGLQGRYLLLQNLAKALGNKEIFPLGRPGSIVDCLVKRYGKSVPAKEILRAVLEGLGPIWPGRLQSRGVNLGDVWKHSALGLVPFHKLSQWMTYSLIEPIEEAGIRVHGVEELTGLAEYRNGGLMLDSGLISLRDPANASREWEPGSDLIIEWRALTVHLLDSIGTALRKELGFSAEEFPLAKALEGGTWWAGRFLAQEKREGGLPPLKIISDGTVF